MEIRLKDLNRRQALKIGTLAFGGLTLPRLLRGETPAGHKGCIILFQSGGASQLDTWDPKPGAPAEIRGSFKPIPTAVPGVHFTELVPRMAKAFKKIAIIRSMRSDVAIHDVARRYIMSGTKPRNELHHPSYGAVVSKEWGSRNGLPPFVVVPDRQDSAEAGFLGSAYDQFVAGDPKAKDYRIKDVSLPEGVTFEEALANKNLLEALDARFEKVEKSPLIDGMDQFYQKAFELISSPATKAAFRIQDESEKLRDEYGRNMVGQGSLLARRLIEAGVRLVSVYHGGYDTHTGNEPQNKKIVPEFDQAFAALVEDLDQRGLLDSTLVLGIGEFGRTPKVNPQGGRDHWPGVFSIALAGGGIAGGQVIGSSDRIASEPASRPVTIEDLGATVYKILGIDYHKSYYAQGRPSPINKDGVPVKELIGG